jgi:Bacterial Ig-like domain/Bacterial pre-peptidase C-terminal domain
MLRCRRPRGLRRLWIALLAAASLVGVTGVAPVAADQTSDIPGTALTGTVTSGLLGGPIYDVVYRVTVPAAHGLLVSMTGDPGTDFDLYLFDSTATSIYASPPVGLVAKSTGPTSTESITYASIGGGTYYIDLSGFANVLGTYRLAVRIAADTTPPQVTLSLNGGAPATNDPTVAATVVATDDLSGVDAMQFSVDGATWLDWTAYAPTIRWSFGPPDGPKELWVRVRDRAGNLSVPAHAAIALDTAPPTVVWRDPPPGGTVAGVRPIFSVQFSEPIQRSTWTNVGLILQDSASTILQGTYTYDAASATGTFTPAVDLQPGSPYVVSLGSITDLAGNPLVPIGGWVVTPLLASRIVLQASGTVVPRGGLVVLTGRMDPPLAGALTLEAAEGNGPFVPIAPIVPSADGTFTWGTPMNANTWFRVRFWGSSVASDATSPTVRILVRRGVALSGISSSITRIVPVGRSIALTAILTPASPDGSITYRIYRADSGGRYRLYGTFVRTSAGGHASLSWRPTSAGRYYVQLTTAPSSLYANGFSPAYRWLIR